MKKTLILLLFLLTSVLSSQAVVYTPSSVPMIHLQDSTRYVCNPEGILSQQACDAIDAIFRTIEDSTGVQSVIVAVGDIDPQDCFEFAYNLFETVGVGQEGKDNGLVVLLSTSERCVQFITGYGLEGILPDAICKRIQEQYMNKSFAKGDWDEGMIAGAEAIKERLLSGELQREDDNEDLGKFGILIFLLFCTPLGLLFSSIRRQRKCPQCGKCKLKFVRSEVLYKTDKGKKTRYHFTCTNCGHTLYRDFYTAYPNDNSSSGGFSGRGGTFGGGGFGGGHFGGGHTGGGGAGSRF
ncbi:MAG: TPM domain-containing protein [Bacteroidaceae bacterium]|nr:TPM domain-containing protein [Bacteroidaceae bacterium]